MKLSKTLQKWYVNHHRKLPWRDTGNPYFIWLSEIILQQTRVDQGRSYYEKFSSKYPTINDLANAPEDEIMKMWQGLGYYSRARNLHAAAKSVRDDYGGVFPNTYKEVRALKGVGDYTAAAIVSFAYGLPHAVVDGNVYRVLSRIFGISTAIDSTAGKKEFAALAQELLDQQNPGAHNQAMMEFGALQCTPKNPDCATCPVSDQCVALRENSIQNLPFKAKKIKQQDRFFNYLVVKNQNQVLIRKRTAKGIWQNLFEFPLIETQSAATLPDLIGQKAWSDMFGMQELAVQSVSDTMKHLLSHQKIYARFWEVDVSGNEMAKDLPGIWVTDAELEQYAIPRLIDLFLENYAWN